LIIQAICGNINTMNQENPEKKSALKFVLLNSNGQKRWFFLALLASLVSVVANAASPQVLRVAIDALIMGDPPADNLAGRLGEAVISAHPFKESLIIFAVVMLAISALAAILRFAYSIFLSTATERFSRKLREKLFRHVQYLPFQWHADNQTGDTIQRCTSDLNVVRSFASSQLMELIRMMSMVVVTLIAMFSMNVIMSLVALAFLPVIAFYSTVFYRIIGKRFQTADEAEGDLTVVVQENLTGVRVVRAFGREEHEMAQFDEKNSIFASLWMRLGKAMGLLWGIGDLATGLQTFSVILAGILLSTAGRLTLGEFIVMIGYTSNLAWPFRALGRTLSEMSKTGVSVMRLQEILDAEPEAESGKALTPDMHADITFEHVSFSYGEHGVLSDISFRIPKGTTFGILGATGSGKSTITYLLNRLYELGEDQGAIYFGDTEISDIERGHLRKNVGLVLQEPFLYSKSIEDNIAIGKEGAKPAAVRKAAGISALDDAIIEFSQGYSTMVGERGVTLSGGQKQRVAIARTLLVGAPVLVFDDSLSAVDLETDKRIRAALKENTKGSTVILISHRINTLMDADTILVLSGGRVEAVGTHAELIAREGTYKRTYELQSDEGDGQ
jgi:ATP-binding cassette subfamily B protein